MPPMVNYFVEVVEAGSISEVARRSFTSQQAVSDHVRRLEEHYQTPLLERTRLLTLTPAGKLVYGTAKEVQEFRNDPQMRIYPLDADRPGYRVAVGMRRRERRTAAEAFIQTAQTYFHK